MFRLVLCSAAGREATVCTASSCCEALRRSLSQQQMLPSATVASFLKFVRKSLQTQEVGFILNYQSDTWDSPLIVQSVSHK